MYRRLILLVSVVVVVIGLFVVHSPAQAQGNAATTAQVRAFFLNVRNGPSVSAARLSVLPLGTPLTVLGRNSAGTWLQIRTGQGLVGWVSALWVRLSSGKVMALPLVSSAVTTPPPATVTGVTASVRAFALNVRNGPTTSAGRIGMLRIGQVVTPLGKNSAGTWLKVQTNTGLIGWVSARWVALSGATLTSLPVVS